MTKLQQAIKAIKTGDRTTGRQLLTEIIKAEPRNESAWLWLANAVDSGAQRRQCLQNVLKINPDNQSAKQGLASVEKRTPHSSGKDSIESPVESHAHSSTEGDEPVPDRPKKLRRLTKQSSPTEAFTENELNAPHLQKKDVTVMSSAAALQKVASDRARGLTPNLNEANLRGSDLAGADLSEASLHHINLSEASLVGANLRHSNLSGADLSQANCRNAKFNEAQLNGGNLSGADLRNANLNGSHLRYADLSGAQLHGANLDWADLTEATLDEIGYDTTTHWPEGFAAPGSRRKQARARVKPEFEMKPSEKIKHQKNSKADTVEAEIPAPSSLPEPEQTVITLPPVEEATKKCPYCAETIKAEAVVCRYCNRELRSTQLSSPASSIHKEIHVVVEHKDPGTTGCLNLIIPGLGYVYIGNLARGVVTFFVASIVFFVIFMFASVDFGIFSCPVTLVVLFILFIEGRNAARRHNQKMDSF